MGAVYSSGKSQTVASMIVCTQRVVHGHGGVHEVCTWYVCWSMYCILQKTVTMLQGDVLDVFGQPMPNTAGPGNRVRCTHCDTEVAATR